MSDEANGQTAADALAELQTQVRERATAKNDDVPPEVAERVAETRRMVLEQLRGDGGDPEVADRLEQGTALSDEDLVTIDAIIHGTGFLVDGKRVDPMRIKIIRWDGA